MRNPLHPLRPATVLAALLAVGALLVLGPATPGAQAQDLGARRSSTRPIGLAAPGAVFTMTNSTEGNAVLAFQRTARGRLAFLDAYPTGGNGTGGGLGNQGGLVLDRRGARLLVVNAGSDSLSVFGIGRRGLRLLDVEPSGGSRPVSVTVFADLVYVLNAGGDGNIAGFRMANDGSLSPIPGSIRPLSGSGTAPAQIGFSPRGRALVVTEKGSNAIVTYLVGPDDLPSAPIVTASEGQTPFGFSFGVRGRLFVSEAFGGAFKASAVSSYELHRDGALEALTASLPTQQTAACWLVVTGDGRFAYTTNTGSDSITGLKLGRDGVVSLLDPDGFTAPGGDGPIDAALSRDSRFLYVLNAREGSLTSYRVLRDGHLDPLARVDGLPAGTNGLAAR